MRAVLTRNLIGKQPDLKYALVTDGAISAVEGTIMRNPTQVMPHDAEGITQPMIELMTREGCKVVFNGDTEPCREVHMTEPRRIVFDAFAQQFVFADSMETVGNDDYKFLVATQKGMWLCENIRTVKPKAA